MRITVQKFGGTSLDTADDRERVVDWVGRCVDQGSKPVVVVSAMGRAGDPYATDTLLGLAAKGLAARERDLLASCGEIIAAVVTTAALEARGFPAKALTGAQAGILTDDAFGEAHIERVNPEPLRRLLAADVIPVVAGFQGETEDGQVTTLGRGASDTTAATLAAALGAESVEIFTDVDGIKTADPRIVPTARTLERLEYEDVFQMATTGARVVHPRAVEIARHCQIPLRVRGTFSGSEGTLVAHHPQRLDPWTQRAPETSVSGVTYLDHLLQAACAAPPAADAHWRLAVFQQLAEAGVSVDLINVFPAHIYFTVTDERRAIVERVLQHLGVPVEVTPDCAKVSVVGSAIHGLPGVMARIMTALDGADVPVLQSSDSHSTISCLIPRRDVARAVQALHDQFHLADPDPTLVGVSSLALGMS